MSFSCYVTFGDLVQAERERHPFSFQIRFPSEELGRKLGSRVDRLISSGNFTESVTFFCLVSRKMSLTQ